MQQNEATQTPKVTGIGGIFFYIQQAEATTSWYEQHLGIQLNAWGSASFESRNLDNPEKIESLQWCPFKKQDVYFAPSEKEFMINYRVQNLETLAVQLREKGVTILDEITTYEFGKFLHIMDPEGNKIELWEPNE